MGGLIRFRYLVFLLVLLIFINIHLVSATNGCFPADPECGSTPTNNCDVRQNTTFNLGISNAQQITIG